VRHTRLRRRIFFAFLGLVWIAGAAVTFAWFELTDSAAHPPTPASVEGLDAPVRVDLDEYGIPTVRAATEGDAWRALGFMHASDRLWQMEFFRRIGAGRLSELFGSRSLAADRFVRTLGLPEIARNAVGRLEADELAALEAYAAGVNARLAIGGTLPPEFVALRFEPEPWTPESSLLIGLVMNLDLSHWRRDLSRYWALSNLDSARASYLRVEYPSWGPTPLDGRREPPEGSYSGGPGLPPVRAQGSESAEEVRGVDGDWDPFDVLAAASIRVASNAWVVGPSRTDSGNPIVANDMHLALRAPAIWYLGSIQTEDGLEVTGFTLPGIPGVVVGFNRGIAWGATNGMVDDMDFVLEEVSEDGRRYREGQAWRDLDVRIDTIEVRGGEPVLATIRSTPRGPLIDDVLSGVPGPVSVLFVPAHVPMGLNGIFALNRAGTIDEFHAAASRFQQPHLNLVAADTAGRIGYRLAGSVPLRSWDGAYPVPAAIAGAGWVGFWSKADHPAATEPERDYIGTANNLQSLGLDGSVAADFPSPFRALRLTQALEVKRDWTVESTGLLQQDVRSLLADRAIGRAIAVAERLGETEAAALLSGWDRQVRVDSRGAPLFYAWFYSLRTRIAGDEWAPAPSRAFFPISAMLRTLEEGDASPWVDDVRTPERESLAELEEAAFRWALGRVGSSAWGDVHSEQHLHPLGENALLDRFLGLNIGPYPSPGGPNTLRPDDYGDWLGLQGEGPEPPWEGEYGPSERIVTELTPEGPVGFALIPTGQSGNPFSDHYDDMVLRWRDADLIRLPLGGDAQDPPAGTLELLPAR
jgi:penicillin amidase